MLILNCKQFTNAFQDKLIPFRNFVGDVHFNALIRLLGPEHLPMIFSELESNVDSLIRNCITPYLVLLVKALPSSNKLPLYEYGAKGIFISLINRNF